MAARTGESKLGDDGDGQAEESPRAMLLTTPTSGGGAAPRTIELVKGTGSSMVPKEKLVDMVASAQEEEVNKKRLDEDFGGTLNLAADFGVDLTRGLKSSQVPVMRETYGSNAFPEPPMKGFWRLFIESFNDTILIILIAAAAVSLVIGLIEEPEEGWIEGTAILIAVLIVALVTAGNDYSKELQFRALEKTSEESERAIVLRDGESIQVHPDTLVIGDVVLLKAGDSIPADGLIFDGEGVKCNESGLTGEPDDLKKRADGDVFMYSSCLITDVGNSAEAKMLVTAVGEYSQWGKIRATLVTESVETPLQQKLERMAQLIGYVGFGFAVATFIALLASLPTVPHLTSPLLQTVKERVIEAFIIGVTIIVVAIPEGLPLAVTISLAYSTRRMYKDQNLIRVLAACETMGNATNICSDKTGTLTENQMTVVEGWFGGKVIDRDSLKTANTGTLAAPVMELVTENCAINRSCDVHFKDEHGKALHKPRVIGNATEGALAILSTEWGFNVVSLKKARFDPASDKEYPFNSAKKRSSVLVSQKRDDPGRRLLVKGASETVLADCTEYTLPDGSTAPLTDAKRKELDEMIFQMADRALRTLCLAHVDFDSIKSLPEGWEEESPDHGGLVCDAIVGIMDPLRSDVKEAVAIAQGAGVMVRMVTGDNIHTAKAIARDCGIYDPAIGVALEGPAFRQLTPAQLDEVVPRLQVLARSSPNDKYLMVTRLNGHGVPANEKEWLEYHDKDGSRGLSWAKDKDRLLPGYREEWEKQYKKGGEVVGVTGDGTNDAPALKAADVGLSMGITGTKVAQSASDIVILDDKFSSIVRAIMWGRSVYDNIRKFLQFQLTVNVVALSIVFIGSLAGFDPPLNAVMMLWVNLIMDTMGALALGTEHPTLELLERKPYGRSAKLVSRPMARNILVQSAFQLILLLWLLFDIRTLFDYVEPNNPCKGWELDANDYTWSSATGGEHIDGGDVSCADFITTCGAFTDQRACFEANFAQFDEFEKACLHCDDEDYTHYSIIFNAFVFCQLFNEFNARSIFDEWNVFKGLAGNPIFMAIILITIGLQILIIEFGGDFTRTTSLTAKEWVVTAALGFIAIPLGVAMRFIPVAENPKDFAGYDAPKRSEALV
ncbi:unnamed protein product [Chrysoparadoxa australica]